MSDDEILRELEKERARALIARDIPALEALFTDDLVHVHTTGAVHDRAALFRHATEVLRFVDIQRPDLKIRIWGDCAVMTGPMINRVQPVGHDDVIEVKAFVTQTWVRQNEQWRQASFHAVRTAD